jgi:prolyl-tRNA synthetase
MGSYGIGISRLLGVIAEHFAHEQGLNLPQSIAPFHVHLLTFGNNEAVYREAESLYHDLKSAGIEVLFDDRETIQAGQKLADADLIGIPYRLVLSERSLENGGVELYSRSEDSTEYLDTSRVISYLTNEQ